MMFATSDSASLWVGSIGTLAAVFLSVCGGIWAWIKGRRERQDEMDRFIQSNSEEHRQNSDKIDALASVVSSKLDAVNDSVSVVRDDVRDMRRDFIRHLENHEDK